MINNLKNNILLFGIFAAGMLSVSISNFFGGSYIAVAVITIILATMFTNECLDKNSIYENKIDLISIGILSFFEVLFFIVNDIFNYPVYVKNDIGFFGICVIATQILCIGMILYKLVNIVLSIYRKDHIELVDEPVAKKEEYVEEVDAQEEFVEDGNVEDLKQIPRTTIKKDAPFMEEEK